jgi:hypothetical protein
MPTLVELQRNQLLAKPRPNSAAGEEMVADHRASLRPSQLVDRKLAAQRGGDFTHSHLGAPRPRAK